MQERDMWKQEHETRKVARELKNKVTEIETDILKGSLMFHKDNNEIVKEFVYNLGVIEGIKLTLNKIDISEDISLK